ncbi:hypothetical protein [Mycobacterium neumannii]|uniref:hypothetical protein n=1 Tax=Mycobacterium neumannii TaxID=2048551 RepID=UPI003AB9045C
MLGTAIWHRREDMHAQLMVITALGRRSLITCAAEATPRSGGTSMPIRLSRVNAVAIAAISVLTLSLVSCSSPAQTFATDGNFLSELCGPPQLRVENGNQAAVCLTKDGDAIGIVGDPTFTTTRKTDAFRLDARKCPSDGRPPVWLRYYDGPNMFAKNNFEEISFDLPVTRSALPAIHDAQSLWDQMTILQPMPVFSDVAPTYCGFGGTKTLWANGGFNFELTAGNTGFDVGDAREVVPWNSPWQAGFNDELFDGWTAYPLMALGNGAGGPPAGYAVRTPGSTDDTLAAPDSVMHAKYTVDNDKQIVVLELSYNGFTSTYAVPQQLFKEKFLPAAIAAGDLAADDKQVGQVNDFMWRWQLFTNTLTIQKPTKPGGKPIALNELPQYFPNFTAYRDIRATVKGFPGVNNPDAFENTLVCAKGFEMYGTLFDDRLFTDLDDYSKWLNIEADKTDPRYQQWRCLEAIARARLQSCVSSGSEKNESGNAWTVGIGYPNDAILPQCDASDPQTAAVIAGARR